MSEYINKNIIFLNGIKKDRELILSFLNNILKDDIESLQFGFFLKAYASYITGLTEEEINMNKENIIEFDSKDILLKVYECLNDTFQRLDENSLNFINNKINLGEQEVVEEEFKLRKEICFFIINKFFDKNYLYIEEFPKKFKINTYDLLRSIGEVWKLIFNNKVWSTLVITAINRSNKKWIVLNDFRFPEEFHGIHTIKTFNIATCRILYHPKEINNNIIELLKEENNNLHISEYALSNFTFDYIINNTLPKNQYTKQLLMIQIESIINDILLKDKNERISK